LEAAHDGDVWQDRGGEGGVAGEWIQWQSWVVEE
jgi:hypothetical protein